MFEIECHPSGHGFLNRYLYFTQLSDILFYIKLGIEIISLATFFDIALKTSIHLTLSLLCNFVYICFNYLSHESYRWVHKSHWA